jgi:hypothetical protein
MGFGDAAMKTMQENKRGASEPKHEQKGTA